MTFKEKLDALKGKFQAKIKAESTPEEIQEVNDLIAECDSLESSYNEVVTENAKFKDTIVRMVSTQGDGNKPGDDTTGSKPKSIEECVAEELEKGDK